MTTRIVQLTESIQVANDAHILYTYDHLDAYIGNAVSFIIAGVQQGQQIIFTDNRERFELIKEQLHVVGFGDDIASIRYVDSYDFYALNGIFTSEKVVQNFMYVMQPFLDQSIPIRVWGNVEWVESDNIEEELDAYERECDIAILQLGILTVCAYAGHNLTASLHMRLMQSHEYVMSDKQLTHSRLYYNPGKPAIFPSLAEHAKIQNEMDFYKKKLDFVQVISHEVRNPLTVIKAYATMLLNDRELKINANAAKKLADIADYVAVIDHEISHILNTEQMLTSEALWQTSEIHPLPIIEEVVTMMEVKARTQSIQLNRSITLTGQEIMNSNATGLRLIISNLLSNAVKYSHEGSCVHFRAEVNNYTLGLEIEDCGIGMSAEQQQSLYRKHEKMNVEKNGQGIGLFMVKKLIDHFGGEIHMDSEIGRGTIAHVSLPVVIG
ncbi:ATP-binding protein [Paenibacillus sp. sgz302251]|uniref:ATP-binding protein n=1 Tax=Paenibacillus sp. sgz302251 TaxID=3414493 RepID=UPI003C7C1BDB